MSLRLANSIIDRGLMPDPLIRFGIRRLLDSRLRSEWRQAEPDASTRHASWAARLRTAPVAPAPVEANEQHYEVPPEFFELVLGPHLKYSSALWPEGVVNLGTAEEAMLERAVECAEIRDGQQILDLGCGWGSMTFFMARRFPNSQILAVSNSRPQGEFIRREARLRNLPNIRHQVAEVGGLDLEERFDRVVSVEMFEHMRNYQELLARIASWLNPDGKLFVHIFCHRELTYPFEDRGDGDWMARHFFTGGIMPAADLLPCFQDDLTLEDRWLLSGVHYQKTSEAWLRNMDLRRDEVLPVLKGAYGSEAGMWLERWRVFFMACAELFGADGGKQWQVAHYRFAK